MRSRSSPMALITSYSRAAKLKKSVVEAFSKLSLIFGLIDSPTGGPKPSQKSDSEIKTGLESLRPSSITLVRSCTDGEACSCLLSLYSAKVDRVKALSALLDCPYSRVQLAFETLPKI